MSAEPPRRHRPEHHFPEDMLLDYATGSLPEPQAILVATHLSLCAGCRAEAAGYEAIGGALLAEIDPAPLAPDALDRALARLDLEEPVAGGAATAKAAAESVLPWPLRDYLGTDPDALDWHPLAEGVDQALLHPGLGTSGRPWPAGTQVSLVRLLPGAVAPRHTHAGIEATVIVQGGFADEYGQYERGDAWTVDARVTHAPVGLPGEACLCLVYLDAPLKPAADVPVASI